MPTTLNNRSTGTLSTGKLRVPVGATIEILSPGAPDRRIVTSSFGNAGTYQIACAKQGMFPIGRVEWSIVDDLITDQVRRDATTAGAIVPGTREMRHAEEPAFDQAPFFPPLPPCGAVVGGDVGYSATGRTTGLGMLVWSETKIHFVCENARTDTQDRLRVLGSLKEKVGRPTQFNAAAIDGPLRPKLCVNMAECRTAENFLMRGAFQRRGKPAATNSGSGPALHNAATELARLIKNECLLMPATFSPNIEVKSLVESFPNLFLGVLCPENSYPQRPTTGRKWTCALYPIVKTTLDSLLMWLLPGRKLKNEIHLRDHEHIAAYACVLTALCAVAKRYIAVGDRDSGYIYLPPLKCWGESATARTPWAQITLGNTFGSHDFEREFPKAELWQDDKLVKRLPIKHSGSVDAC